MKKLFVLLLVASVLAGCASVGSYTADMPDLFLGKIQLRLENYGPRTGVYTKGVYASFKNTESGVVSSVALDSEGYFETSSLDEGAYLFTGLWVDQLVIPQTRSFRIPTEMKLSIMRDQVNVFGDLTLTYDQSGKAKAELDSRVEAMKAFFATKASSSPWLEKHWRSVFPG